MLVLTQAAAGALAVDLATGHRLATTTAALVMALLGLAISIFHLGRPERAWRALAGWRHSWLSREVGALGLFGILAFFAVLTDSAAVQAVAVVSGLAGVGCSGMLYVVTRRPSWRASVTLPRFALGALVGGAGVAYAAGGGRSAALVLAAGVAAKLLWEAVVVWRTATDRPPERRGSPVVYAPVRHSLGVAAICLALAGASPGLALVLVLAGELMERSRFFTTASWTGMPGPKR
jgi:DMSO reductase anchor subunit